MLKPKTTEQVSTILKYCYKRGIAVCVQGGNTGLVGGSVPVFDEVILSISAMNSIISFNKLSGKYKYVIKLYLLNNNIYYLILLRN